jgi:hypothetical protein
MLIGLHGKAQSGKTTVANFLKNHYFFVEISFAAPIKALVRELFDMSRDQVEGNLKEKIDKRYGFSPRWLLQHLGTNVFRVLYPEIWIDYAMRTYRETEGLSSVISDVRFKNEKEAIEKEGGVVWKIIREDHHGASSGIEGHASENDLDDVSDSEYAAVLSAKSGDIDLLLKQAKTALLKEAP